MVVRPKSYLQILKEFYCELAVVWLVTLTKFVENPLKGYSSFVKCVGASHKLQLWIKSARKLVSFQKVSLGTEVYGALGWFALMLCFNTRKFVDSLESRRSPVDVYK